MSEVNGLVHAWDMLGLRDVGPSEERNDSVLSWLWVMVGYVEVRGSMPKGGLCFGFVSVFKVAEFV